jgi:hypothetical protein
VDEGEGAVERLDEEKIDVLRRWGEGLVDEARDELRAAGRAILLLIEEIERLHVDLWNERSPEEPVAEEVELEPELPTGLRARLGQFGRKSREEVSEPGSG